MEQQQLQKIFSTFDGSVDFSAFPFNVPAIKNLKEITFRTQVTFFVGENGSGKSTLLEAIAAYTGFGPEGGSKNINFTTIDESSNGAMKKLAQNLRFSWSQKPKDGYFFRAESFYNLATKIDDIGMGILASYGNKSLHKQSHGESFLSLFQNRIGKGGFFIFDEPEAALSPQRQLALLSIMHELCKEESLTQFIIATHSPIILAYPGSTIYSFDTGNIQKIQYEDTAHYQLTKSFLDNRESYFAKLFCNEKFEKDA